MLIRVRRIGRCSSLLGPLTDYLCSPENVANIILFEEGRQANCLQYNYIHFGSKTHEFEVDGTEEIHIDQNMHTLKVGVNSMRAPKRPLAALRLDQFTGGGRAAPDGAAMAQPPVRQDCS